VVYAAVLTKPDSSTENLPNSWITFNADTRQFVVSPAQGDAGAYSVAVTATVPSYTLTTFTVNV
jgi:hypothetical protein